MERFPELEQHQVAVVIADANTGQVFNLDLTPDRQDGRGVYKIFDDVAEAVTYAKSVITEKPNLECVIQAAGQETVHYITPKNVREF